MPVGLAVNGSADEPKAGDVAASFRQGLIFVRAAVNEGPDGVFLLDTGASETVVDARYAAPVSSWATH